MTPLPNSTDNPEDRNFKVKFEQKKSENSIDDKESQIEIIEKDYVPHFFPTYRISRNLYPLPIIIVVICAGLLAYISYFMAGVRIEGGYVSEEEYGVTAGIINGLIFVISAVISSFVIIFLVKKRGIGILKYVFGGTFGFLGFLLTLFFGEIILFLIFYNLPDTELFVIISLVIYYIFLFGTGAWIVFIIYKYFTSESFLTKNFIVLYIGMLIGALLGVIMPLWTTLAILIGISLWDLWAVKSKRGPIREMIDIASQKENSQSEEEIKEKLKSGEMMYDTSKLEIGIGDLAFYSMLTSSALIVTGSIIVMILTAIAIIIGTGITIQGLKRNKVLPGLPISIFLGIGTMLLSWYIISL